MTLYLTVLVILFAIFIVSLVASNTSKWVNMLLTLGFAGVLVLGNFIYFNAIGLPKPIKLEFLNRHIEEATVMYAEMVEDVGIYLVLAWEGSDTPRFYIMPWDKKKAQELAAAQNQANKNGKRKVKMRFPFKEQSQKQELMFHPDPVQGAVPKAVHEDWIEFKRPSNTWSSWREGPG